MKFSRKVRVSVFSGMGFGDFRARLARISSFMIWFMCVLLWFSMCGDRRILCL